MYTISRSLFVLFVITAISISSVGCSSTRCKLAKCFTSKKPKIEVISVKDELVSVEDIELDSSVAQQTCDQGAGGGDVIVGEPAFDDLPANAEIIENLEVGEPNYVEAGCESRTKKRCKCNRCKSRKSLVRYVRKKVREKREARRNPNKVWDKYCGTRNECEVECCPDCCICNCQSFSNPQYACVSVRPGLCDLGFAADLEVTDYSDLANTDSSESDFKAAKTVVEHSSVESNSNDFDPTYLRKNTFTPVPTNDYRDQVPTSPASFGRQLLPHDASENKGPTNGSQRWEGEPTEESYHDEQPYFSASLQNLLFAR